MAPFHRSVTFLRRACLLLVLVGVPLAAIAFASAHAGPGDAVPAVARR